MVEMLLEKGAKVNEKMGYLGETALHKAYRYGRIDHDTQILRLLLKYGADGNILDNRGITPLTDPRIISSFKKLIIQELVLRNFEGQVICSENLEYLRAHRELQTLFDDCSEELQEMKSAEFYSGYSLYDILKMERQPSKLIPLIRNEDLVVALNLSWNRKMFDHYGDRLDDIVKEALRKRDIFLTKEEKRHSVLEDDFPELIIPRVA